MFCEAQQNQHHPTVQPANECDHRKNQKALSMLQLLSEVTITLFVAGVLVPTFWYTLHSLGAAVGGGLLGALVALAIEFRATLAKAAGNFLMFWQAYWKCFLSRPGRPSFDGKRSLA